MASGWLALAGPAQAQQEVLGQVDPAFGTFETQVPLETPDFRGLEPALSLSYNSGNGNGLVGVGWALEGPSYVERISSGGGAPAYTTADSFQLDGQALVASTGLGGTHATRVQSYARISWNSTANTWTVTAKDGTRRVYTALLTNAKGTFRWALSTVTDTNSQQVSYTYWCDGQNDCYPSTIAYNGTTIRFHHEARPDVITFATGAGLGRTQYRLRSVDVTVGGNRARAYQLTYVTSQATGRSVLSSVQEFGRDATLSSSGQVLSGTAKPPTTFATSSGGATSYSPGTVENPSLFADYWNIQGFSNRWVAGDINGDKRSDWMGYAIHSADAVFASDHIVLHTAIAQPNGGWAYTTQDTPWAWSTSYLRKTVHTGDFNGDGLADFIAPQMRPSSAVAAFDHAILYVGLSNGSGGYTLSAQETTLGWNDHQQWLVSDINKDGRHDLVFSQVHGAHGSMPDGHLALYTLLSQGTGTFTIVETDLGTAWDTLDEKYNLSMGDYNGDGAPDLMLARFVGRQWFLQTFRISTAGSFTANASLQVSAGGDCGCKKDTDYWGNPNAKVCGADSFSTNENNFRWETGDINGDGKTDFMLTCEHLGDEYEDLVKPGYPHAAFYSALSDGAGGFTYQKEAETDWVAHFPVGMDVFTADADGDGTTDFMYPEEVDSGLILHTVSSTGVAGAARLSSQVTPLTVWGQWTAGDVNADGRPDFMQADSWSGFSLVTANSTGGTPDLVVGVSNGWGGQSTVSYVGSTTWPGSPTGLGYATVSSLQVSDGRGVSETSTYSYTGLKALADGSSLGFRTTRETFNAAGDYRLYTHRQTLASRGRPELLEVYNAAGQRLTYFQYLYTENASAPFTSLLSQAWKYECAATSTCVRSLVAYTYNTYGNVTREEEYGNYDVSGDERTKAYVYVLNTTTYLVDRPSTLTLHVGLGTTGAVAAKEEYYYDGNTQLAANPSKGNLTRQGKWNNKTNSLISESRVYDTYGNVTSVTDALSRTRTQEWDTTYRIFLTRSCNALNQCESATYDAVLGKQLTFTDANSAVTTYGYDALGRPTFELRPDGSSALYTYHDQGNPQLQRVRISHSDGSVDGLWSDSYQDGLGRTFLEVKKGGALRQRLYADASERVWRVSQWYGPTELPVFTAFTYDGLGRVVLRQNPDGSQSPTSYGRDFIQAQNEVGRQRTTYLDGHGRIARVVEQLGATNQTVQYAYNVLDLPTAVTDAAGRTTTLEWDSLQRQLSMTDPDRGKTSYTYDAAHQLTSTTDARAQTLTRTYDAAGRVLSESGTGWQLNLTYDQTGRGASVGRLTTATYSAGSSAFHYDTLGRLTQETRCVGSVCKTLGYSYDSAGRLQTLAYPDGELVTYGYDMAGRPASLSGYVTSAEYDAADRLVALTYANGTRTALARDVQRGWLASTQVTGPAQQVLSQTAYGYDTAGRMTGTSSSTHAGPNLAFGYDSLHRLTSVSGARNAAYTYGGTGTLLSSSTLGAYGYNDPAHPQAVTSAGGSTYTYDAAGNLLSGAGRSLSWNAAGLLTSATVNGVTTTFSYGLGEERVRKGATSYFGPHAEVAPNGTLVKHYLLGGRRVARQDSAGTTWLHADHLGSVRMVTDVTGAVVGEYEYDDYGQLLAASGSAPGDKVWAGHPRDEETGLVYMQARYYEPWLGRFISADSMVPDPYNTQAYDRYAYVYNSPLNYVDPDGHRASQAQCGTVSTNCSYPKSNETYQKPAVKQLLKGWSTIPPTVAVGMVARKAVSDMNRNGNRFYAGVPLVGNVVDNFRFKVLGSQTDRWWKCEDQAPFVANRINRARIPGVHAAVQFSGWHSWVLVNVGGTKQKDGSYTGGKNYYIDPWSSGAGFVKQPDVQLGITWDESDIRHNIEPDGPDGARK